MHEIDVAASDAMLGALALWLGWRTPGVKAALRTCIRLVMFSVAAGAWLGAIWHGFLAGEGDAVSMLVWRLTMLAAGLTAYGFAMFGMVALGSKVRGWTMLFRIMLAGYALALVFSDDFRLAIALYVPAVLLTLSGFVRRGSMPGM